MRNYYTEEQDTRFTCHTCFGRFYSSEVRFVDSKEYCQPCGRDAAKIAYAAHMRVEMLQVLTAAEERIHEIADDYGMDDVCGDAVVDEATDRFDSFMHEMNRLLGPAAPDEPKPVTNGLFTVPNFSKPGELLDVLA